MIGLPRKPMAEIPRPDKLELTAPKERNPPAPNYGYSRDRSFERRSPRDPYRRENFSENRGRARTPEDFRRSRSPYRERRESGFPSNRGYSPGRGENNRTQYGERNYRSWGSGSGRRSSQDNPPSWDRNSYPPVSYTHLTLPTILLV